MLRTRLFLNLAPFLVLLLAIGIYAIILFSRLAASVNATVAENYQSVIAAQSMSLALSRMQTGVMLALEDKRQFGEAVFLENHKLFEQNLARPVQHAALPGEKDLAQQLTNSFQALHEAGVRIFASAQPEQQRAAYAHDFYPRLPEITILLDRLRELNHQAILATSENAQKLTRDVTRLMIVGIWVALLISGYACYQLSRSVLAPIQSLTKATQELGRGNLDQLVPVVSNDELGKLAESFNKMAAQLQAYRRSTTEEILRLHRTMEVTLASFPDPIFVLDQEGRVELKNPAARDLEAALQLQAGLPERLQDTARLVLRTGQDFLPHHFKEAIALRVGGQDKHFLPRILAMRHEEGLVGVAVVLYDITRFRLIDDLKTNLLGTVSHELKTPLTSVRMALHLLLEKNVGSLTSKQQELVVMARAEAERLLRILNDLLDLTRLEEGSTQLNKQEVPAAELVQRATEDSREALSGRHLRLRCAVESDLPAVWVDRQRITHVFTNFISNAVKHSPDGGEILLRAARSTEGGVQFSVIDQGPGIPEEYHTRIFDRFFRVPGQTRKGAGLGLSIAREIAVAHGGRIGVKSQPGMGSEFFLVLAGNGEGSGSREGANGSAEGSLPG